LGADGWAALQEQCKADAAALSLVKPSQGPL
jgi:hypothetical protein